MEFYQLSAEDIEPYKLKNKFQIRLSITLREFRLLTRLIPMQIFHKGRNNQSENTCLMEILNPQCRIGILKETHISCYRFYRAFGTRQFALTGANSYDYGQR